jgi:hypothetical protein
VTRTRISLYYLAGYLLVGGFALLFAPVRLYFIACLVPLYRVSRDPFFLVVLSVVAVGVAFTLMS